MNNTQQYYGLKELSSVVIRAFTDIKVGNHFFEKGEPILYFEKLQISELSEKTKIVSAKGGKGNYPLVVWENFGDLSFALTEGVLSKMSFGMLVNSGVFDYGKEEKIIKVPKREQLEIYGNQIELTEVPRKENLYIYGIDEQGFVTKRIDKYEIIDKIIMFQEDIEESSVIIDYYYDYTNSYTNYIIGNKKIEGLFSLEGKAYFKNENSGLNQTFLFEIPKMKITSNIDIIMGEKASPNVSVFNIIGLPIKENNQFIVSKMYLLSDDIDATI